MAKVEISRDVFWPRVQRVITEWPWPEADALFLVTGILSDDAQEQKTVALHHWLFSVEFPELVLILERSGKITFWASPKKLKYFEELKQGHENEVVLQARSAPVNIEADSGKLHEILATVRRRQTQLVVASLSNEVHVGPFSQAVSSRLLSFPDIQVVDARGGISEILTPKDAGEVQKVRGACQFAACILQDKVIEKMQDIVDQEIRISHLALCNDIEGLMENEAELTRFCAQHQLDSNEMDITYLSVQSGRKLDLRPAAPPNNDDVAMTGTYLISIGTRCTEYSGCVSRTMLVNPKPHEKQAYLAALEVENLVIQMLIPGVSFKDIYVAAKAHAAKLQPTLVSRFVRSVGFLTGLEFRDAMGAITERSDRKVMGGSTFVVMSGFEAEDEGPNTWAVWLADTVFVPNDGPVQMLTSYSSSSANNCMWELSDDIEEPQPAAKAPSVAPPQQAPPPKAASAAAAPAKVAAPKAPPKAKATPRAPKNKAAPKAQGKEKRSAPPKAAEPEPRRSTRNRTPPQPSGIIQPEPGKARTSRTKTQQVKEEMAEQVRLEAQQRRLRQDKLEEMKKRFAEFGPGAEKTSRNLRASTKLSDCQAYASPAELPLVPARPRLQVDPTHEALLVPYKGALIPFHIRTIRNVSKFETEAAQFFRINFFHPGQGKKAEDFPRGGPDTAFLKELLIKCSSCENFDKVTRDIKEVQKRMKTTEAEVEVNASRTSQVEVLQTSRAPLCVRDVHVRPNPASGSRRVNGNLEAHVNGFRFTVRGSGEKVEIFYSQIKQAIFQPCETSALIVLIHFHMNEPIMLGKKRTFDVQFFTETAAQTEDLSMRRAGNAYDPDEILEEQREAELKQRLNQVFHEFVKKVEALPKFKLDFDVPQEVLSFFGVPNKATVRMFPCATSLVSVQEQPFFCLDMKEVEIVVFERALLNTREFDVAFVKKDYNQQPVRVTMVPSEKLGEIKSWLSGLNMIWYTVSMNMQWQMVLKEVLGGYESFLENGGWEAWFGEHDDSEESAEAGDDGESDFVDESSGDDEDEEVDDDEDADFEEESSEAEMDDSEESGKDWDELEAEAEQADRKRDVERGDQARKAAPPPTKRARRR
eukprot:TRINITY_DN17609_c3_g1_i1.p1 TRINITY_DN17609_c3_g1~~TRINITY_DN17609_c3_g1_i1.p1  ORF type:complete len:1104 (-),score=280.39 TRINITY_DN17609_c3_g1_i1:136-3426(-)